MGATITTHARYTSIYSVYPYVRMQKAYMPLYGLEAFHLLFLSTSQAEYRDPLDLLPSSASRLWPPYMSSAASLCP